MESKNIAQTLLERQPAITLLHQTDDFCEEFVVLHKEQRLESFEGFLPSPRRTIQVVKCSDIQGFIAYVNAYKGEGTALFPSGKSITAVLDYHAKDKPSWCDHKAVYLLSSTVEWRTWTEQQNRWLDQRELATFLQENEAAIADPPAGIVRSMVQQFKATTTMRHVSELDSGGNQAVLEYRKESKAVGSAQVEFPAELTIELRAYEGSEVFDGQDNPQVFRFTVALRWKVEPENTGVKFAYQILGLKLGEREAFNNLLKAVTAAVNVQTFVGASID